MVQWRLLVLAGFETGAAAVLLCFFHCFNLVLSETRFLWPAIRVGLKSISCLPETRSS